jgi:outer membrane biosynthesis protein TonB
MKATFLPIGLLITLGATVLVGCQSQPTVSPKPTSQPQRELVVIPTPTPTIDPEKNKPKPTKPERKPTPTKPKPDKPKPVEPLPIEVIPEPELGNAPVNGKRPTQAVTQELLKEAETLRQQGKLDAAANTYRQAQNINGAHTQSYARLSEIALKKGNPREAERQARMGLAQAKTAAQRRAFWTLIALSLDAQGKKNDASRARYEASRIK